MWYKWGNSITVLVIVQSQQFQKLKGVKQ